MTRAHAVLRGRRRIHSEAPKWALSHAGLSALIARVSEGKEPAESEEEDPDAIDEEAREPYEMADGDPLAAQFAGLDVSTERAKRLMSDLAVRPAESRDPLVYDLDWNETARLASWRQAVEDTEHLPPLLGAAIALLAWEEIEPLQHKDWLGRLLVGSLLRVRSRTPSHLLCANMGLRAIARERRRAQDPTTKLVALLDGFAEAAKLGMKEHDRWLLARRLARSEIGGSTLELQPARAGGPRHRAPHPIRRPDSTGAQSDAAGRAGSRGRTEFREMTGRGRYRAWGII